MCSMRSRMSELGHTGLSGWEELPVNHTNNHECMLEELGEREFSPRSRCCIKEEIWPKITFGFIKGNVFNLTLVVKPLCVRQATAHLKGQVLCV